MIRKSCLPSRSRLHCCSVSAAAAAEEDPIKARKALMKANGDQAKIAGDMSKGDSRSILRRRTRYLRDLPGCGGEDAGPFPRQLQDGDPSDQFNASPKIWENMADFKARFVKFGEDAKAAELQGPRQLQGGHRQYRQERLRRLPSELSPEEELNERLSVTRAGIRCGWPALSFFMSDPHAAYGARANERLRMYRLPRGSDHDVAPQGDGRGMTAVSIGSAHEAPAQFAQSRARRRARAALGFAVFWFVTIPATVSGLGAAAVHAKSRQRQDHVRHRRLRVVPCRAEQGSEQGRSHAARRRAWRSDRRSAPSMRRTFRPIRKTASAPGAKRISSPRCGRARRRDGRICFRRFPTRPISTCSSTTCAICLPI